MEEQLNELLRVVAQLSARVTVLENEIGIPTCSNCKQRRPVNEFGICQFCLDQLLEEHEAETYEFDNRFASDYEEDTGYDQDVYNRTFGLGD
jgi:hypothetical protein